MQDRKWRITQATIWALAVALAAGGFFLPSAAAHPGWGIVIDRQGQVYFTDLQGVWKIDRGGRLTRFVTGKHTHDLYLDSEDNLFGEHLTYDAPQDRWWLSVWKATPEGALTDLIPPTTTPPRGFSLTRDPSGTMYSWDGSNLERRQSRILKRTPEGEVAVLAGGPWGYADGPGSSARFSSIGDIALGPEGALYVTDSATVRKITREGTVTTLARDLVEEIPFYDPASEARFNRLMGLAVDPEGNVYVANYGNRCVLKITPAGGITTVLRSYGLWMPTGVAVADDNVYVLEYLFSPFGETRVRMVSPDGKVTTLATTGWTLYTLGAGLLTVLFLSILAWRARHRRRRLAAAR